MQSKPEGQWIAERAEELKKAVFYSKPCTGIMVQASGDTCLVREETGNVVPVQAPYVYTDMGDAIKETSTVERGVDAAGSGPPGTPRGIAEPAQ